MGDDAETRKFTHLRRLETCIVAPVLVASISSAYLGVHDGGISAFLSTSPNRKIKSNRISAAQLRVFSFLSASVVANFQGGVGVAGKRRGSLMSLLKSFEREGYDSFRNNFGEPFIDKIYSSF